MTNRIDKMISDNSIKMLSKADIESVKGGEPTLETSLAYDLGYIWGSALRVLREGFEGWNGLAARSRYSEIF